MASAVRWVSIDVNIEVNVIGHLTIHWHSVIEQAERSRAVTHYNSLTVTVSARQRVTCQRSSCGRQQWHVREPSVTEYGVCCRSVLEVPRERATYQWLARVTWTAMYEPLQLEDSLFFDDALRSLYITHTTFSRTLDYMRDVTYSDQLRRLGYRKSVHALGLHYTIANHTIAYHMFNFTKAKSRL